MLCHHIHRDFAKVKVRPDARRRRDARRFKHIANHVFCKFPRRLLVHRKIMRQVDKAFVNRIDMDIVSTHVFQINVKNAGGILHVLCHLRRRHNVLYILARLAFDFAHFLDNFEQARTSGNPVSLKARTHR